jgi:ABC-type nitrate/sulfonate/bicarbonate transport system substrate-binding protein
MAERLRLNVFNIDPATSVARQRGSFDKAGLALEIAITPNSTDQMRGLGAGRWEIVSTAFDNVLAWSGREGAEIVAVAQAAAGIVLPVYVRAEVRDWADLRGKPLAVDAVDTAYALVLRRILLAKGLDLARGDYELIPAGATGQRLEAMKRGEAFAAILNAPWDKQAEAAGMRRLADHREVLPDYPGGVLAVSRAWADANRDLLVSFLRAWSEAGRWARDPRNREEAIGLVAADQNLGREEAAARLSTLPPGPGLNLPGLKAVLDLRTLFGFSPPLGSDLARYHDLRYLEEAGALG